MARLFIRLPMVTQNEMDERWKGKSCRSGSGWAWLTPSLLRRAGLWRLSLLLAAGAGGASFNTSLDRNVVPIGETVTLSLTFEGVTPNGAPTLPPLAGLQVAPGVSQQSQFSFVNGQQTSRLTYSYTLIPTGVGTFAIPAMQVVAGGQTLTSQPLSLQVVAAAASSAGANNALSNLAFVKLFVPKTEVYVGEPFPLEIQLYVQTARDVHMPQLQAEGFSLSKIPQPSQSRTAIGNAIYDLVTFKLVATAARSGDLTLGPVEEQLKILVPASNPRRSRDPFDSFFFGGPRYQEIPTTLTSEKVLVRALPLPQQNVPANFNGAIGSYRLSVTAGPTNLGVGDPITVRVQISGQGPLDAVVLPPQPAWRDFTSYPPTSKVESTDEFGLAGTKTFEQVLAPQNHELTVLPPVQFAFFDPSAKSYRTLTGPAIPITVRPSTTAAPPPPSLTNAAQAAALPADDIIHIKPRLDLSAQIPPLLLGRRWFLFLQAAPALAWISFLIRRKSHESLANNPRLRRQREVTHRIREGLKELDAHAQEGRPDDFFSLLFRLLQEQLGERLDLPASAITEAVIEQRLNGRGLGEETLRSLHELFQTCNLARYAAVQSSQELTAQIPKLEKAIQALQRMKP